MKGSFINALTGTGYYRVSKILISNLGLLKAFALTDLIDKFEFYRERGQLVEDKWFFYRREDIEKVWGVQSHHQREILNDFVKRGLLQYEKKGPMPKKNYYTINIAELEKYFEKLIYIEQKGEYNSES